jgi:hypothetical protein
MDASGLCIAAHGRAEALLYGNRRSNTTIGR